MYDGPGDTMAQLRHYISVLEQHRAMLEQQRQDIEETLKEIQRQQPIARSFLRSAKKNEPIAVKTRENPCS